MSDPLDELRVLVAPGELRAEILELFDDASVDLDVLLAAPGLLSEPPLVGAAAVAKHPHRPLSAASAFAFRRALLESFGAGIDAVAQSISWEKRIHGWIERLAARSNRVFFHSRLPVFGRLISKGTGTVVPMGPITAGMLGRPPGAELDLRLEAAAHVDARRWFREKRTDSEDLSDAVRELLESSWAGGYVSPGDLYYKVLAEYFRGTVGGLEQEADSNPLLEFMTEFQADAYRYAKQILRRYGGVFLADVVGLGKTYIGLALLKYLQDVLGIHAVVVAPPAVCPTWRQLAAEFRVELQTVSHGKLEDLASYDDREVLLVDESHNFRNADTQRYEELIQWARPEGRSVDRLVILLSATPQNNGPRDVLRQLQLFPQNFVQLPFRGESLEMFFSEVEAGRESLASLLQHVVVRRTRSFVLSAYPEATLRRRMPDGSVVPEPLRFPARISGPAQCLRYRIEEVYGGSFYGDLVHTLASLRYPLHGLAAYVRDEARGNPALQGLAASGASLRGLFKVLLLKRLESSLHAFRLSLKRHELKLADALDLLASGKVRIRAKPRPASAADDAIEDSIAEEEETVVSAELFEPEALRSDLEHDLDRVRGALRGLEPLDGGVDAKLARLRDYLGARPPSEHKTVVFTQFADTANYVYERLGQTHGRTAVVTGSSGNLLRFARRFAPKAMRAQVPPEDQLDLLISTDALSEGVNLQDGDTLVNYDLHWNPVRLIQRAGRIDRLGSDNQEIHIASFLPERGLEVQLGLEAVLRRRIQEFLQVFGEDSYVLPSDEALDEVGAVDAYTGKAFELADRSDEMDGLGRHAERILSLKREDPERYARVLALRAGRRSVAVGSNPTVAATRLGWFWAFWSPDKDNAPARLDDLEGLQRFYRHAQSGEAAADSRVPPLSLGEFGESARANFAPLASVFREQRTHPRLAPVEDYVRSSLERYRKRCALDRAELVQSMIAWVLSGQHRNPLRRLARLWRREGLTDEAIFTELRGLLRRYPLTDEYLGEEELVGISAGTRADGTDIS